MHRRARHLNTRHAGASLVLDARRISGLNDGDAVSTWNDVSGNGWDATGSGGGRPLYKVAIQGGQAVVQFNGGNGLANVSFNGTQQSSIVSVAKVTATGYRRLFHGGIPPQDYRLFFGALHNNTSTFVGSGSAWNDSSANSPSSAITSFGITSFKNSNSNPTLLPRFNGVALTAKNGTTIAFTGYNVGTGFPGQNWAGSIAYLVYVPLAISIPLLRRIEHSSAFSFKIKCS